MKASPCLLAVAALALSTAGCEPASENRIAKLISLSIQEPCDPVASHCVAAADGLTLGIRMPGPVRTLTKFPIEVQVSGMQPQEVIAEFSMVDMDMGQNRYRLIPDPGGAWRAEVILPFCASGRRDWVAAISARTSDRTAIARFPFQAAR